MEPFPVGPRPPSAAADEPLDVVVTDMFRIRGRGTVTTGQIRSGIVRQGDVVENVRPDGQIMRVKVRAIEFNCGPLVPRDLVGLQLESAADDFIVARAAIRSITNE